MVKKVDLQGVIEGLTEELAEQLTEADTRRDIPLVIMRGTSANAVPMNLVTLNAREIVSVNALISWAAANSNISEKSVRALVADKFERMLVEDIAATHYDHVIRYLVEFSESIN